jgi:hypothetical protein
LGWRRLRGDRAGDGNRTAGKSNIVDLTVKKATGSGTTGN